MKITATTALVLITIVSPTTLLAQSPATKADAGKTFEATKTIAAGSLNPPNPREACIAAKKNAIEKAESAGFKGRVVWARLSSDSDCKLAPTGAGRAGYFYIFTAKGTFYRTGIQDSPDPQADHKAKFKAGCLATHQSWIENPDGSYQCVTRSGEINKCFKNTPPTPCVHTK